MKQASISAASLWALAGIREPIILASGSPRRARILKAIGIPFKVAPAGVLEGDYGRWDGGEILGERALQKAECLRRQHPGRAVLAADTIVLVDDQVLGKPADAQEARRMLGLLSGREHEVWTAVCYYPPAKQKARTVLSCTKVAFRELDAAEIEAYIETGEPMDKAGAYGIQGIGGLWVSGIAGCYFNVVGLPLSALWELLNCK